MTLLFASLVGACGDNRVPLCEGSELHAVRFNVFWNPELVSFRDGMGPWQPATELAEGSYQICVREDYELTVACVDGYITTYQHRGTAGDPELVPFSPCRSARSEPPPTTLVKLQMQQPGHVQMGGVGILNSKGPWAFELPVSSGVHRLFASDDFDRVDENGRMRIRPAHEIAGERFEEPLIDLDVEPETTRLESIPLELAGGTLDELIGTQVVLVMPETNFLVSSTKLARLRVAPANALAGGGSQFFDAFTASSAGDQRLSRSVSAEVPTTKGEFELLPKLTSVILDRDTVTARWQSLPVIDYSELRFAAHGFDVHQRSLYVSVSRSWVELHGSEQLTLDASVPGYDAEAWMVSNPTLMTFVVSDEQSELIRSTAVVQITNTIPIVGEVLPGAPSELWSPQSTRFPASAKRRWTSFATP
jgi:hypothetical protein